MRKVFYKLLFVIAVVVFASISVNAETLKYGDVNNDNKIEASDALLVLKHAAKLSILEEDEQVRAEVSADNTIDASDALWILKYASKLEEAFPVGNYVPTEIPTEEPTEVPTEVPTVAPTDTPVPEPTTLPAPEEYPLLSMPVLTGSDEETEYGKLLYNYAAVSDVHVRETDSKNRKSVEKFDNFVAKIGEFEPDFILCAGDIGRDYTEFEFNTFKEGRLKTGLPWYSVTGNHDTKFTEEEWLDLTGSYLNFTLNFEEDIYIFVSLDYHKGGKVNAIPYSTSIDWLEGELKKYKGHRIFLTIHFPPKGYSGLRPNQIYGFEADCTQDEDIVRMVRETGNVIVFTGHTHLMFELEDKYENITVYSFPEENCHLVHIPSLGWPINTNAGYPYMESEFFFVDVYEDAVVLEGARNSYTEENITKYENRVYTLNVENSK